MGEAKRKSRRLEEAATALGRELADQGKLIEAGFVVFASAVISPTAPEIQTDEMRLAFMAGAEHVFSSISNIMDPGDEPTEADLRRMDLLHQELDAWRGRIAERVQPAKGQGREREFNELAPEQRLGDAPVQQEYHAKMAAVIQGIDKFFNGEAKGHERKTGLVLMVFPFGDVTGRTNYMSNGADRRDIVVLMREMIARFEGQPEVEGRA